MMCLVRFSQTVLKRYQGRISRFSILLESPYCTRPAFMSYSSYLYCYVYNHLFCLIRQNNIGPSVDSLTYDLIHLVTTPPDLHRRNLFDLFISYRWFNLWYKSNVLARMVMVYRSGWVPNWVICYCSYINIYTHPVSTPLRWYQHVLAWYWLCLL